MFWVIQEDLFQENGRQILIETFERFNIPYQIVKVVPVSHELIPEITQIDNIITNGSVLLSKIAMERNWNPGSFLNSNFDYNVWFPIFKEYLLNRDAIFTTVADALCSWSDIFVRPVLDNKSFNGSVLSSEEFVKWRNDIMAGSNSFVKPNTEIVLAKPKKIGQEHRHFIVDGNIVTSSRYKLNHRSNYAEGTDQHILNFVQDRIREWQPARAFVLDTYQIGDEVGIVELGCITCAGFYKADIQKLVMTLNELS
jgi:hypothetical protein